MPTLPAASIHSRARRAGYDPAILEHATVAVVGAGALGQNVLLNLALSGVHELRIVDGDLFEEHNRSRSPLHPRRNTYESGDALQKAASVARELRGLHVEESARILYANTWIEELGFGAFEGVDVIAACADSLVARAYLARTAMRLGIPIVDGGFSGANIGMTVYPTGGNPQDTPCWSCGGDAVPGAFSCVAYARYAEAANIVPAIQTGAAALGSLCAEAVIGLLHQSEACPRRVALDLRSGKSTVFHPRPDPVCSRAHRRLPVATGSTAAPEESVRELLAMTGGGEAAMLLRDIYVERANCPSCTLTCEVEAPASSWRRNPMCTQCGGAWTHAPRQLASPDTIDTHIDASHARADLTLAQLGFQPGDIVELHGATVPAVRLAGAVGDLFEQA